MSYTHSFECPECGAPLQIQEPAPEIACSYCGKMIVVPEELRPKPTDPSPTLAQFIGAVETLSAEQMQMEQARRVAQYSQMRAKRKSGSGIRGFLGCLLVIGALAFFGASATGKAVLASAVPAILGESTVAALNLPLQSSLPRQVRFASLQFTLSKAAISNQPPSSSSQSSKRRADQAYAYLDLQIANPLAKSVLVQSSWAQLRLKDGTLYKESTGWSTSLGAEATKDVQWVFPVPVNAVWQGAQLVLNEPGKEPLTLPLDGAVPAAQFPRKLAAGGEAKADVVDYRIMAASFDVDFDGTRADQGKRFLILSMRFANTSNFAGGFALIPNDFRLLADGVSLEPFQSPVEVLSASSTKDGQVVFVVPATIQQAVLQVGEIGHATARIPLALTNK